MRNGYIATKKFSGHWGTPPTPPTPNKRNKTKKKKTPNDDLECLVCFLGLGATDVYGPKAKENTGLDQFFYSYASFFNNFADSMRSTVSH